MCRNDVAGKAHSEGRVERRRGEERGGEEVRAGRNVEVEECRGGGMKGLRERKRNRGR